MTDQVKNMIIGLFIIAACLIVIFILLFLHPSTGDEGKIMRVRFSDIDKVNIGTRVTFAGKPVGEVLEIKDIEHGRDGPQDESGHIYVYELTLAIDSGIEVYDTDEITLRTSGLLGERSVAIIPIALKKGMPSHIVERDEILYAAQVGSVEETMKEFKEVADKFDTALDNITTTLLDIRDEEIVKKFGMVLQNIRDITGSLNRPEDWSQILTNVKEASTEFATRLPTSWNTLDDSLLNFKKASADIQGVAFNVSQGKGSAGKILVSDDLYLRLTSLLNKGETIADDMNHYGLLYHLDKGWQRLRARRMNLMRTLSSPQQFRNYFNDEIDQITTSLSRVSMVLEQTPPNSPMCPLVGNPEFTKVFAELLRRVGAVEDSLKMYDQEIIDTVVHETELNSNCCQFE